MAVELEIVTIDTGDEIIALPIDMVKKNFVHNYCRTCHSFQGLSVDKPNGKIFKFSKGNS